MSIPVIFLIAFTSTFPFSLSLDDYNDGFSFMENRMDRFWDRFNRKMDAFRKRMENMGTRMEQQVCKQVIGNEYNIVIKMPGFNARDISVDVKDGQLTIKALHNVPGEALNSYLYVTDLPNNLYDKGSWTYNAGVFKMVFHLNQMGYSPAGSSYLSKRSKRCDVISDDVVTYDS
ncbi:small heat shock protein 27.2 [Danaus plexippus plexippus]|uniref:Small heat shock protein 27.2 n=1 Tax=Danaus plexippus plexippus TaxID=278856 RepID=A0A212F500_DANPL|nr:uncharacterized protein LOC116773283 [Danaus plexippus plexippus]OWR48810.1 small heat shock protein 27.2 [Danaus plexippus plexippus]